MVNGSYWTLSMLRQITRLYDQQCRFCISYQAELSWTRLKCSNKKVLMIVVSLQLHAHSSFAMAIIRLHFNLCKTRCASIINNAWIISWWLPFHILKGVSNWYTKPDDSIENNSIANCKFYYNFFRFILCILNSK